MLVTGNPGIQEVICDTPHPPCFLQLEFECQPAGPGTNRRSNGAKVRPLCYKTPLATTYTQGKEEGGSQKWWVVARNVCKGADSAGHAGSGWVPGPSANGMKISNLPYEDAHTEISHTHSGLCVSPLPTFVDPNLTTSALVGNIKN